MYGLMGDDAGGVTDTRLPFDANGDHLHRRELDVDRLDENRQFMRSVYVAGATSGTRHVWVDEPSPIVNSLLRALGAGATESKPERRLSDGPEEPPLSHTCCVS